MPVVDCCDGGSCRPREWRWTFTGRSTDSQTTFLGDGDLKYRIPLDSCRPTCSLRKLKSCSSIRNRYAQYLRQAVPNAGFCRIYNMSEFRHCHHTCLRRAIVQCIDTLTTEDLTRRPFAMLPGSRLHPNQVTSERAANSVTRGSILLIQRLDHIYTHFETDLMAVLRFVCPAVIFRCRRPIAPFRPCRSRV